MKCEDVAKQMIPYLDGRSKEADRTAVDQHLAGCAECRARSQELFTLWKTMDELPAVAPSFGFDARMRQRIAAEPRRSWFTAFIPQPRLALSAAMLIVLSVWVVKMPASHPVSTPVSTVGDAAGRFQRDPESGRARELRRGDEDGRAVAACARQPATAERSATRPGRR
jgi:anti-sigma factor RsiW